VGDRVASTAFFLRSAGYCAFIVAAAGFAYSILFVLQARGAAGLAPWVAALLLLGGLLTIPVLLALYETLRDLEPLVALLAIVLGVGGALGAALHGSYDLATSLHPVAGANAQLPNPIDPRGFMTFGVAGLSLLIFARLLHGAPRYQPWLAWIAALSAVLLIVIYLGRLVILTATNPLVIGPAALEGLIVNPLFYVLLGLNLRRI
jgi:hypothetical protein